MKKLIAFALVVLAFAPAVAAQTAASFAGKWEGSFVPQRADGTDGNPNPFVLNLTQKGKVLTGTGGPADRQWPVDKGVVTAGKATFQIQQPDGPLFKFTVSIVKARLTGGLEVVGPDGAVRGKAKVDGAKAATAAKK